MRGRLPLIIGLSMGLHLLAAFALMSVPGQELVKKVMPIVLVERQRPRPPVKPKEAPRPKQAAAKRAVPKLAPRQPVPRPVMAARGAAEGPAVFGVAAGPGGTMEVPVGESLEVEATASAPAPLELDFSDTATVEVLAREPEPIGRLRVNYPEVSRVAGATGSALVQAWVEADGRVTQAQVLSYAGGLAFARAAEQAVRQTRFKPALRDGVAVACSVKVPISFSLAEVSREKE